MTWQSRSPKQIIVEAKVAANTGTARGHPEVPPLAFSIPRVRQRRLWKQSTPANKPVRLNGSPGVEQTRYNGCKYLQSDLWRKHTPLVAEGPNRRRRFAGRVRPRQAPPRRVVARRPLPVWARLRGGGCRQGEERHAQGWIGGSKDASATRTQSSHAGTTLGLHERSRGFKSPYPERQGHSIRPACWPAVPRHQERRLQLVTGGIATADGVRATGRGKGRSGRNRAVGSTWLQFSVSGRAEQRFTVAYGQPPLVPLRRWPECDCSNRKESWPDADGWSSFASGTDGNGMTPGRAQLAMIVRT